MKTGSPFSPPKFRRILVATDFSKYSDQAAALALTLLAKGGRLCLLHVVEPVMLPSLDTTSVMMTVYDSRLTLRAMLHARLHLKALARRLKGVKPELVVKESASAALEIAAQAKRHKADLLCLSTHGQGGLSRLVSGSVAQKALAHFQGTVIMVRPSHKRGGRP